MPCPASPPGCLTCAQRHQAQGWPVQTGCPGVGAVRPAERPHHCCLIPLVVLPLQRDKMPSSSKKVTFGLNRNMTAGECGRRRP